MGPKVESHSGDSELLSARQYKLAMRAIFIVIAITIFPILIDYDTQNYFEQLYPLLTSFGAALVLTLIGIVMIRRFAPSLLSFQPPKKPRITWIMFIPALFLSTALVMILNGIGASSEPQEFTITRMWLVRTSKGRNHYEMLQRGDLAVKCHFGEAFNASHHAGERITVFVHRGTLGFDYLSED